MRGNPSRRGHLPATKHRKRHLTKTEASQLLAAKFPRLFQTSEWPSGDVPDGWFGIVRHTLQRVDTALSDPDAAAFQLVGVEESSGRLVMVARYPAHCDPEVEQILGDAWDASEDICELCGDYSAGFSSFFTLCRQCARRDAA